MFQRTKLVAALAKKAVVLLGSSSLLSRVPHEGVPGAAAPAGAGRASCVTHDTLGFVPNCHIRRATRVG